MSIAVTSVGRYALFHIIAPVSFPVIRSPTISAASSLIHRVAAMLRGDLACISRILIHVFEYDCDSELTLRRHILELNIYGTAPASPTDIPMSSR